MLKHRQEYCPDLQAPDPPLPDRSLQKTKWAASVWDHRRLRHLLPGKERLPPCRWEAEMPHQKSQHRINHSSVPDTAQRNLDSSAYRDTVSGVRSESVQTGHGLTSLSRCFRSLFGEDSAPFLFPENPRMWEHGMPADKRFLLSSVSEAYRQVV